MSVYIAQPGPETDALIAWLQERLPGETLKGVHSAVAVLREGKVAAVMSYFNYSGANIELAFAADSPRWATRNVIAMMAGFPFQQLDCRRMTAVCRRSNTRVHRLLEGIGFKREGTHYDLFPDEDGVSFGMTKRWFMRSKWNERRR